jgi:hypothetical protein
VRDAVWSGEPVLMNNFSWLREERDSSSPSGGTSIAGRTMMGRDDVTQCALCYFPPSTYNTTQKSAAETGNKPSD